MNGDKTNLQTILDWFKGEEGEDWDYMCPEEGPYCPICGKWFRSLVSASAYVNRYYVDGMMEDETDNGEEINDVVLRCSPCHLELEREQDTNPVVRFNKVTYSPEQFFNKLNFLLLTGQELTEEKEVSNDDTANSL